jgi:hypothetical protein
MAVDRLNELYCRLSAWGEVDYTALFHLRLRRTSCLPRWAASLGEERPTQDLPLSYRMTASV